jgi:catechol 2,3-dioxygenase-like lactoylglutathione lyase family enzyme
MSATLASREPGVTRREAIALCCAVGLAGKARAAEAPLLQPVTVDHINLRVADVARSAKFYNSIFGGPILRVASIAANPTSPAGEAFYIKTGETYLVISPAFTPDTPGLDHVCFGVKDYAAEPVAARLRMAGIMPLANARPGSDVDVWARDGGGIFVQLRSPGGWARLSTNRGGVPAEGFATSGAFSVVSVKRIALRSPDVTRSADFYGRLFGTETRPQDRTSRAFAIADSILSFSQSPSSGQTDEIDFLEIGVKAFAPNVVRQTLRERGILAESVPNSRQLRINDPDGIAIRLS